MTPYNSHEKKALLYAIYLYPTTYMNPEEDAPEICPIDDPIARTTEATL